jgi:hypothetical protein
MMAAGRVNMKWYWIALGAIAIFTMWPIAAVLLAMAMATVLGCTDWPGGMPSPCLVFGFDVSHTIAAMLFQFFGIFTSIMIGSVMLVLWFVAVVFHHAMGRG